MKTLRIAILAALAAMSVFGQQLIFPVAPPAPIARFFGTTGATARYYWVVARYPWGISTTSASGAVTNGNATLSATNVINVTWSTLTGATGYDLLRTGTNVAPTTSCNCALVVNTTTPSYNDNGASLLTYTVATPGLIYPDATAQTTAASGAGGSTSIQVASINDTGNNLPVVNIVGAVSAVNQVTVNNAATTNAPVIEATGSDSDIDLSLTGKGNGIVNIPGVTYQASLTITTANLNAGTSNTVVPGHTGWTYTPVGISMRALGGNTSGCTAVVLEDTSAVAIATEVVAGLVQDQVINEASSVTNLTLGAGWNTGLTAAAGIRVVKTGGACATATSFVVTVLYKIS